jgi:L-lactate dehydrogenase complex protein LldF
MNNAQFRERIRKSISNDNLQLALDANAERRVKGRIAALESLPDWRERRQQAHAIRADVIEHLDEYLDQFINNAAKNGIIVHRAKDPAEAIKIILRLAEDSPQSTRREKEESLVSPGDLRGKETLVAKSKSMVSEEINLNHALEAEGMRVVETDLGEYIVQLRHERPAHIITPAVHLRRSDVGQLFHEKLGIPYTEDIPTLTSTARKVLREVFLTAQVGVSGVNFAIADTGGFCLVTNEGNGRMVTTLPPVHIALMGMERLVRNLDDLALLLSLLARSATTQKLSVYTQLIHKPLAHQQRHIIILDNGRSRLRNSPLKESLFCIRCGACLNACPVFRELGGHAYKSTYSGPIGSVISAGLFGSEFVPLAQASSLCGACKEACPVDIDLPKLLTRVRAGQAPQKSDQLRVLSNAEGSVSSEGGGLTWMSKIFLKIYSRAAPHPKLFALSQKFAWLGTSLVAPFSDYVRLPAFTGWGYSKDLPRFAGKTFRERWRDGKQVDSYTGTQVHRETRAYAQVDRETTKEMPSAESVTRASLVSLFVEELSKVGGTVIHTTSTEVTDKVIHFLQSRDIDCIHLEPDVLDEELLSKAGISISHQADPTMRAGLTKAICGLADTGSILEADGEGDKLQASLLTEIHLAVLKKSDIYPSLSDAIHLTRDKKSAVFITGPSRTADIEMTLTIGVHGPGELHVLLVDD